MGSGANLASTVGMSNWEASLNGITGTMQFMLMWQKTSVSTVTKRDSSCTQLLTTALSQEGGAHSAKEIAGSSQSSLKHTYHITMQARLACPEIKFLDWRPGFPAPQQA